MAEKEKFYMRVVSGIILLLCGCVIAFGVNLNSRIWQGELERTEMRVGNKHIVKKLDEISQDVKTILRNRSRINDG